MSKPKIELTSGQLRALRAVERGEVTHVYRGDGNAYHGPKGVGSLALRNLEQIGLIMDGRDGGRGGMMLTARVVVTKAGAQALSERVTP